MKRNKILSILASAALIGGGLMTTTSCSDDLDLQPIDQFSAYNFWGEQKLFEGNLTALMNQWRGNYDALILYQASDIRAGAYIKDDAGIDGSSLDNLAYINNQYNAAPNVQFNNFANFFGMICNLNTFLYYAEQNADVFTDPLAKSYLEGMVYGMRAMCYFQLHKMYGTCPLRIEPDVVLGNYDPTSLYMPRAAASAVIAQIEKDIKASLAGFAAGSAYKNTTLRNSYYWSEAATKMLAGEFYMWISKVSTGDYKATDKVDEAEKYFNDVVNNYGLSLQANYWNVFRVRQNKEIIFETRYDRQENSNNSWGYYQLFSTTTGRGYGNFWWMKGDANDTPGYQLSSDIGCDILLPEITTANRLGYKAVENGTVNQQTAFFLVAPNFVNRMQVRNTFYYQFKKDDVRRKMFVPAYLVAETDKDKLCIENFDSDTATIAGCYVYKFPGQIGFAGKIVGGSDAIYYRLPLAYMYLAEIANWKGNNGDVEKYINLVRARAYGENWDESVYGYKAGSFAENEVAILREKDKEFYNEGQRFWDLCRLSMKKNGEDSDHLVFQPESNIGNGLDLATLGRNHLNEVSVTWKDALNPNNQIDITTPVLDYAKQAYMRWWPLNSALLGSDPKLEQTPGY